MKIILLLLFFSICYTIIPLHAAAQKKYNIIFIPVDDLSIAFDAYGNPEAPAPNFARLMQHGMLFKQAYCQFTVCNPSRTSILSGKRPDATGVFENQTPMRTVLGADYKFLPEYFHAYGYRTEKYGKVSCQHEDEISWDYIFDSIQFDHYNIAGTPHWWLDTTAKTIDETLAGIAANKMIAKMEQPIATPYFYAFGASTHNPSTPILEAWNKTGDSSVQELLPVNLQGTITNVKGNGSANITLPNTPPNDTADIPSVALKDLLTYPNDEWQRMRHAYYSEIIEMDEALGLVLDELDRKSLWDSTIVVFISDHGVHLGEHEGLWLKLTLFEETLRVPFVICAPGKRTGVCNTPVELVDLYSTLSELCGLPKPQEQEGFSLVPLLENPEAAWKKAVFGQVKRFVTGGNIMGRAVRTDQYHYNSWQQFGEELYDISADPFEYTNLAGNAAYANVLNAMRTLLANGWAGALPPVYIQHSFFKDTDVDGYGNSNDSLIAYFTPTGYTDKAGDCNDNNAAVHPNATEQFCNGIDDNCDGNIDENKPKPVITALGSLDICQTGTVTLQSNKGNGFSYQWQRNGIDISGAVGRNYIANKTGNYKVTITHTSGCSNTSKAVTVTSSCAQVIVEKIGITK